MFFTGETLYFITLCIFAFTIILLYNQIFKNGLFLLFYFASLFIFGFFSFQFRHYYELESNISYRIKELGDKKIFIKGRVAENPDVKQDRIRLIADNIIIDSVETGGQVLISVFRNKFKEDEPGLIEYGNLVEIEGRLEELPRRHNPGEFDYGQYLKLHGIDAAFYSYGFGNIKVTGKSESGFYKTKIINSVRNYSIDVINKFIGGEEGEYLKGLVLGERSNISKKTKDDFVNAGVSHIIAVSGLNVAYVIIVVWGLLLLVPVKQTYKIIITILFLIFYMNLTGNTPSIIRATIMAAVFLSAGIFERRANIYNIIAAAALIILIYDPRQLFDAGFILSFTAIISIVILHPEIQKLIDKIKPYERIKTEKPVGKSIKFIITLFTGTLAAQIGTLPVTALMFKKVSIVSLAVNMFAIPLSNIALAAGFLIIIASVFSAWLASVFASFNILLLYAQLKAISYFAGFDYAFFETYFVNYPFLIVYYLVLILSFSITKKNYISRLVIIILIIINFTIYTSVLRKTDKAELTYIDAGNSNSTLIKMPGGTAVLINCGGAGEKFYSAERNIIPYLKLQDINNIDLLFLNSLNINEYKNLMYLLNHFKVKMAVMPVYYKSLFKSERFKNTVFKFITGSEIFNRKGNFRIYVYYNPQLKGESMMTELVYGEQSFIFNDSKSALEDYINTRYLPDENALMVLKSSGTGRFDFNSPDFIAFADPEFVVVSEPSKGRNKKSSEVYERSLNETGFTVLRTDKEGAVIFETDGYITNRVMWR